MWATLLCTLLCLLGAGEMFCPGTSNLWEERDQEGVSWVPPKPTYTPMPLCLTPGVGSPCPQAHLAPGACPMVSHALHLEAFRHGSATGARHAGLLQAVPLTTAEALRAKVRVGARQCGVQGHRHRSGGRDGGVAASRTLQMGAVGGQDCGGCWPGTRWAGLCVISGQCRARLSKGQGWCGLRTGSLLLPLDLRAVLVGLQHLEEGCGA